MTHKASNFNPNHIFVDTNVLVGGGRDAESV